MTYSTIGGQVTRGETYAKLMDHLREAQECCIVMSHLHNTETDVHDVALSRGWMIIGELMRMFQHKVTSLAQGKLQ
jgi:hypothetical protein